ncbi:MAG: universal stress protein [Propioniciclava sp.]|uniref:universal stress protein n=1 Tax=Propioniciclava sp. TaxID=2038686 RepID=UPI0039E6423E
MTIIVGVGPRHQSSGALELAAALSKARDESLLVVTVVPPRWSLPSMARVDAEFAAWAAQQAELRLTDAATVLNQLGATEVSYQRVDHRSQAGALLALAQDTSASLIVVGSSEDGRRGHIEFGSTSDGLVHSAELPVGVAPRGYAGPGARFTRVTCAVTGDPSEEATIKAAAEMAAHMKASFRLVTFAVRLDTMYPPEVGLNAEDEVVAAARDQARQAFEEMQASGILPADAEATVGVGRGWRASIESVPWQESELLVLGSKPRGALSRVFLGSAATKIVRHSPVPVILLPA